MYTHTCDSEDLQSEVPLFLHGLPHLLQLKAPSQRPVLDTNRCEACPFLLRERQWAAGHWVSAPWVAVHSHFPLYNSICQQHIRNILNSLTHTQILLQSRQWDVQFKKQFSYFHLFHSWMSQLLEMQCFAIKTLHVDTFTILKSTPCLDCAEMFCQHLLITLNSTFFFSHLHKTVW